ncbi:MAG: hypothetical protein M0R76_01895 [Proteobacteria bacterium]|nr:hypothetical protein [Pseudomonadota bacterium]
MQSLLLLAALLFGGCVRTAMPPQDAETLAATPSPDGGAHGEAIHVPSKSEQAALEDLVRRDAPEAAAILHRELANDDGDIAALAAIYTLRLNLKRDDAPVDAALLRGTQSQRALIACLAWRWLAQRTETALPKWQSRAADPLVQLFAALAHVVRGQKLPSALAQALALSHRFDTCETGGPPRDIDDAPWRAAALVVDDGPLIHALRFHETRRAATCETGDNGTMQPASLRHYRALCAALHLPETPPPSDKATQHFARTRIPQEITTSLTAPLGALRQMVVHRQGSLQREAICALAQQAQTPVSGDFAAARAAMESDDPRTRIEAARTYLLLTARATLPD